MFCYVTVASSSWKQCCDLFVNETSVLSMLKERVKKEGGEYKSISLEENQEYQCYVSFVDDSGTLPWTFCVQLQTQSKQLEQLMLQVTNHTYIANLYYPGHFVYNFSHKASS
jgi:hypothetical protein